MVHPNDVVDAIAVADDDELLELYLWGLSIAGAFRSRDEVDAAVLDSWTGGKPFSPASVKGFMGNKALTSVQRRNFVAFTWPRPFEEPVPVAEIVNRIVGSFPVAVAVNFAVIAWRWWHSWDRNPPQVDGRRLELGEAAGTLGPNLGIAPAAVRGLMQMRQTILAVDEILDLTTALRMTFSDQIQATIDAQVQQPLATRADFEAGRWSRTEMARELPRTEPGPGRWWVDDVALSNDAHLERKLQVARDELAVQLKGYAPGEVHRLRVKPYGDPPDRLRSIYYALFSWLDNRTEGAFETSIDDLAEIFAGRHADQQHPSRESGAGARRVVSTEVGGNLSELPPSARKHPGWWSAPDSKDKGVGKQTQRIAWLAAGYRAKPLVDRSSGTPKVAKVRFTAVPGRDQWHPYRHRLRAADAAGESADDVAAVTAGIGGLDVDALVSRGVEFVPWFSHTWHLPISKDQWQEVRRSGSLL